ERDNLLLLLPYILDSFAPRSLHDSKYTQTYVFQIKIPRGASTLLAPWHVALDKEQGMNKQLPIGRMFLGWHLTKEALTLPVNKEISRLHFAYHTGTTHVYHSMGLAVTFEGMMVGYYNKYFITSNIKLLKT
ncbi:hypothetical protein ACJX0J_008022, partial [Zea mays]